MKAETTSNVIALTAVILTAAMFLFTTVQSCSDSRFSEINESIQNTNAAVKTVQESVNTITTDIAEMKMCMEHMKEDINDIKEKQDAHEKRLDKLSNDVTHLKAKMRD